MKKILSIIALTTIFSCASLKNQNTRMEISYPFIESIETTQGDYLIVDMILAKHVKIGDESVKEALKRYERYYKTQYPNMKLKMKAIKGIKN